MSESRIPPPPYGSIVTKTSFSSQNGDGNLDLRTDEVLSSRLNATRQVHIQTIISEHVLPILEHRTDMGLSRTSIALLPVNIVTSTSKKSDDNEFSKSAPRVVDIVSGHDVDDDLQHITLTSAIDTSQFWSQSAVVDELRRGLKERLSARPDILKIQSSKTQAINPPVPLPPQSPPKSRRFFSRRSSSKDQDKLNTMLNVQNSGIAQSRSRDLVTVDVQPEEICLRTQSDFGLYETLTRPALLVRVQIHG